MNTDGVELVAALPRQASTAEVMGRPDKPGDDDQVAGGRCGLPVTRDPYVQQRKTAFAQPD